MSMANRLASLLRLPGTRAFSRTVAPRSSAYDADGKTSVTILNREAGLGIMVDTYSKMGFRLNNGAFIVGPVVIFPKTVLSWNVAGDEEISPQSLELFTILDPKPDIVVVGYANYGHSKLNLDKTLHQLRVKHHLNLEVLPTDRAVATFNFLNAEGRYVVAALIPPRVVNMVEDDIAQTRDRRKKLYEMDD